MVRGGPGEHPGVEGELSAVGRDGERVVVAGVHLLRPQAVVAGHELTLERGLFVRHRAGDDDGLPGLEARAGEVQHLGRLHVGKRPKHLLQLGQVREFGKAAPGAERRPVGGDFHRVDHLAESRRPGVEMLDAAALQTLGVEEPLDGVHLDHRVRDRRAGGKGHAVAGVPLVEIPGLHVEIKRALAPPGLDAGHAVHLGRGLEILEEVRLVNEDVIDAEFVKHQAVVLLVLGQKLFEPLLAVGFLLLDGLDEVPVAARGVAAGTVAEELVVFPDLLAQEFRLVGPRHAYSLKRAVGDDDAVPLAACDLGGQELAALARQIFLAGDEELGVGIELHELAGELLEHVVGDGVKRLSDESRLLHLHAGGGHGEGLTGADGVGQQRVAATHGAPHGIHLVRVERDRLVHAGKVQVRPVEEPRTEVVIGVVVEAHQPVGAIGLGKHPGAKALLDLFLLVAGGERGLVVHDPLLAVAVVDGVIDDGSLEVQRLLEEPDTIGSDGSELGGGGDRALGGAVGVDAPDRILLQVADANCRGGNVEKGRGEVADVVFRYPRGAEIGVDVAGEHVLWLHGGKRLGVSGVSRAGLLGFGQFRPDVAREISVGGLPRF